MNSKKTSNHFRPVAFFLIAVALILIIGFAAFGRQTSDNISNNGDADINSGNTDKNTATQSKPLPGAQQNQTNTSKYENYLTGIECSEDEAISNRVAFLIDSFSPTYGISSADIIIEFPTETEETRFLAYIGANKLPTKIGSISPTRGYINNIIKYFGGTLIANSNDSYKAYNSFNIDNSFIDLSVEVQFKYTEYSEYIYTNNELLNSAFASLGALETSYPKSLPYSFESHGEDQVKSSVSGNNIIIPYANSNETEFTYSKETNTYVLSKNGKQKHDLLNDKKIAFNNIFILFADAVTYETSNNSELVLDTVNGGNGIYFTEGTRIYFTWSVDGEGTMTFYATNGQKLTVNRGTAYIGFMKASRASEVTII